MMEIDYKQFTDEQLPSIYSLFNVLSYPSIYSISLPSFHASGQCVHVQLRNHPARPSA